MDSIIAFEGFCDFIINSLINGFGSGSISSSGFGWACLISAAVAADGFDDGHLRLR